MSALFKTLRTNLSKLAIPDFVTRLAFKVVAQSSSQNSSTNLKREESEDDILLVE
jgi:hypothetical protein